MNISAPPKSYLSVLNQHHTFMLETRLKRGTCAVNTDVEDFYIDQ